MTRLHHRDRHLRRGYQREIIDSSIKTINRLVLPYITAHANGNWDFIGELFKASNYILLVEEIARNASRRRKRWSLKAALLPQVQCYLVEQVGNGGHRACVRTDVEGSEARLHE